MIPFVRETENSVFALLLPPPRYAGRALIDEAWSRRRSEGRPFVRGPRSLFRQVARKGEGGRVDPSRVTRWLPIEKFEIVCGVDADQNEKKKKLEVSWEMAVRWKRSVFIEPLLIYFALFVSWFFRFFFFFFFFERYIWRMNFWLEYEFKGLKCDPTSLHKFLHKEIVFIWKR